MTLVGAPCVGACRNAFFAVLADEVRDNCLRVQKSGSRSRNQFAINARKTCGFFAVFVRRPCSVSCHVGPAARETLGKLLRAEP
jgi:hypothetical protein